MWGGDWSWLADDLALRAQAEPPTVAPYRRRGIYRALVARRAQLAVELGYRILQVDATEDSRPILERLGLFVVGGSTPYIFGRDEQ